MAGTITFPPFAVTFSSVSSTLATSTYVDHRGGTEGSIDGLTPATIRPLTLAIEYPPNSSGPGGISQPNMSE